MSSSGPNRDISRPLAVESIGNASGSALGGPNPSPAPGLGSGSNQRHGSPLLETDVVSLDKFKLDQVR